MASLSITNSFTAGTTIVASQVNTNFTDTSTYINNRNAGTTDWDFVSSAGLVTAKANIRVNNGTVSVPSISFTADTDTGFFATIGNLNATVAGTRIINLGSLGLAVTSGSLLALDGTAGTPSMSFDNDRDTGVFRQGTNAFGIAAGGIEAVRIDGSSTATHTRLLVYDVDNATLERVTVGAADSGGSGFKVLRIPN